MTYNNVCKAAISPLPLVYEEVLPSKFHQVILYQFNAFKNPVLTLWWPLHQESAPSLWLLLWLSLWQHGSKDYTTASASPPLVVPSLSISPAAWAFLVRTFLFPLNLLPTTKTTSYYYQYNILPNTNTTSSYYQHNIPPNTNTTSLELPTEPPPTTYQPYHPPTKNILLLPVSFSS